MSRLRALLAIALGAALLVVTPSQQVSATSDDTFHLAPMNYPDDHFDIRSVTTDYSSRTECASRVKITTSFRGRNASEISYTLDDIRIYNHNSFPLAIDFIKLSGNGSDKYATSGRGTVKRGDGGDLRVTTIEPGTWFILKNSFQRNADRDAFLGYQQHFVDGGYGQATSLVVSVAEQWVEDGDSNWGIMCGAHHQTVYVPTSGNTGVGAPDTTAPNIQAFRAHNTTGYGQSRLGTGGVKCVQVAGRSGVAEGAGAVAVNLTAVDPSGYGHMTLYPKGVNRPLTSNLNYRPGETIGNSATVAVGDDGEVCAYSSASTDFVLDVIAFYPYDIHFTPVYATRVYDSGSPVGYGSRRCVDVAAPSNAAAVSINVAVVAPAGGGYLTVYPYGSSQPGTSNGNYDAGQTMSSEALVEVGTSGKVCVYTHSRARIIIDLMGYFQELPAIYSSGSHYEAVTPWRATKWINAGTRTCLKVAGVNGVPSDARRVFVNMAIVSPSNGGWAKVLGRDEVSDTANMNFAEGQTVSNGAVVNVGPYGQICAHSIASSNTLIFDVLGYFK